MIIGMPNIHFNDEQWLNILKQYLNGWTNIPLSDSSGYNRDELKFYDGFIGFLLKQTEQYLNECPSALNMSFINSWKYQGKLYRIIHPIIVKDDTAEEGVSCKLPDIEYHGMISHWTDDYTFKGLMHKLYPKETYIILEADTQEHLAFDVNKFRKTYKCENPYTEKECEIIFPMYKECIKEYCMSVNDFIQFKQCQYK
ncbi:hypothetical protein [Staphylococcus nepalensis]|uniref:hypothetical protein n=1 Tax=Staphylococcus nepalensis TaxID=214473 RepID=UPI0024BA649F|nr:hypothetical protein [Staphylococcus nepalensis]